MLVRGTPFFRTLLCSNVKRVSYSVSSKFARSAFSSRSLPASVPRAFATMSEPPPPPPPASPPPSTMPTSRVESGPACPKETLSIAPMMAYTNRHFRYFMRLMTKRTVLYSEMVVANAMANQRDNFEKLNLWLGNDFEIEHPVVLQLGGSSREELEIALKIAMEKDLLQYDAVNLNCGCPSQKVAGKGAFGAALMLNPQNVADIVQGMRAISPIPVSVKCRIGVNDQDTYEHVHEFVSTLSELGGCVDFTVHARKAWLKGLNPKQNRSVPPLKHEVVYRLIEDFPHLNFYLNGGIKTAEEVNDHLSRGVKGVMIGRGAFENPWMFASVDSQVFGDKQLPITRMQVLRQYAEYCGEQEKKDPTLSVHILTKPLHGFFYGVPQSKVFNRNLIDNLQMKMDAKSAILRSVEAARPFVGAWLNVEAGSTEEAELYRSTNIVNGVVPKPVHAPRSPRPSA